MQKSMLPSFVLLLGFIMVSCQSAYPKSSNSPVATSTPASPAPSPERTATPFLSPTASPIPLPTSTLTLPLVIGTPIPLPNSIISSENASSIEEIASWAGHACSVFSLAFSPDSESLVSTSCDGTVRLWSLAIGSELRNLENKGVKVGAVFSPDGKTVVTWSNGDSQAIKMYDVVSGSEIHVFEHSAYLYNATFSPDGKTLAAAAADGTVRLWDLPSGNELPELNGHLGMQYGIPLAVFSIAISPDGTKLASADQDGRVRIWDLTTGKLVRSMKIADAVEVVYSKDGSMLAVTTWRSYNNASDYEIIVNLYDVASGSKLHKFSGNPDKGHSSALSPDGRTLVVALQDGTIVVYDTTSGKELRRLSGHTDGVYTVAFSPDGRYIASGSGDGDRTIRLWGIYP
jgi:WD40 repeat protein